MTSPRAIQNQQREEEEEEEEEELMMMPSFLVDSTERNERYNGNWAQFMLDCESHPATTFNFCGGMKFGLSFTRKFRERLETLAKNTDDGNVVVQESNV